MGRKLGAVHLWGELGPHVTHVAWADVYLPIKWHLDPSSRLATTDTGRKLGGGVPLFKGELGSHVTQCGLGRGLLSVTLIHATVWPQHVGQNWGCCAPPL